MAQAMLDTTAVEVVIPASPVDMHLEIGHAAVARNRRLLSGVAALVTTHHDDICGLIFRTIYETWLVGLYGLLGGPSALERLVSQQDRQLRPILEMISGACSENGERLPVEELAREVVKILRLSGNQMLTSPQVHTTSSIDTSLIEAFMAGSAAWRDILSEVTRLGSVDDELTMTLVSGTVCLLPLPSLSRAHRSLPSRLVKTTKTWTLSEPGSSNTIRQADSGTSLSLDGMPPQDI